MRLLQYVGSLPGKCTVDGLALAQGSLQVIFESCWYTHDVRELEPDKAQVLPFVQQLEIFCSVGDAVSH